MWSNVGILRDAASLTDARRMLCAWHATLDPPSDRPAQELADLLTCARLTTEGALLREESRGAHWRTDFPDPSEEWHRHIVFRASAGR
jgi:L-aspartate oxidase